MLAKAQKSASGGRWTFQEKNVLYVHSLWSLWNTLPSGTPSNLGSESSSQKCFPQTDSWNRTEAVLDSVYKHSIQNQAM